MTAPTSQARPRTFDVYTMELGADGAAGAVRRITATEAQEAHIQYSPDGAWLVFTSGMGGIDDEEPLVQSVIFNPQSYGEIYAHHLADGRTVRLTHNKWEDGAPLWARAATAPALQTLAQRLLPVIARAGADSAAALFRALAARAADSLRIGVDGGLQAAADRARSDGRPAEALAILRTLAGIRPADPSPLLGVAAAQLALADTVAAIGSYRRALGVDSTQLDAEMALVRLGAEGYRAVRLRSAQLDRLVGRYAASLPGAPPGARGPMVELVRTEDGLAAMLGPQRVSLTATSPLVFVSPVVKFVFQVDEGGAVTGLRALNGHQWIEFTRSDAGQ